MVWWQKEYQIQSLSEIIAKTSNVFLKIQVILYKTAQICCSKLEAINRKQITRWQHVSRLKASSFGSW
jgi:hypothetical protein